MAPTARPTVAQPMSPHLQIYRWTWTMAMSVFHRITGTALYGGTALVAIWLVALASGPVAYSYVAGFFGSLIVEAFRANGHEPPRLTVPTQSAYMQNELLATGRFLTVLPSFMLRVPGSEKSAF